MHRVGCRADIDRRIMPTENPNLRHGQRFRRCDLAVACAGDRRNRVSENLRQIDASVIRVATNLLALLNRRVRAGYHDVAGTVQHGRQASRDAAAVGQRLLAGSTARHRRCHQGPPGQVSTGVPIDMIGTLIEPAQASGCDTGGLVSASPSGTPTTAVEKAPIIKIRNRCTQTFCTQKPGVRDPRHRTNRRSSADAATMPSTAATISTPMSSTALDGVPINRVRSAFTS